MELARRSFIKLVSAAGAVVASGASVALEGCAPATPVTSGPSGTPQIGAVTGSARRVFDPSGRTLELDSALGVVRVTSAEGSRVVAMAPFGFPRDAAVAPDGRIAVVDASNHSVTVHGPGLDPICTIQSDALRAPTGAAFAADGTLLVTDGPSHCVRRYDASGAELGTFGSFGSGAGELNGPRALAVEPNGDVHVADTGNRRVQVFCASGNPKGTYDVGHPVGIAFDGRGRAWVADRVAGSVAIHEDGVLVERFVPEGGAPRAVDARPDGSVYITVA